MTRKMACKENDVVSIRIHAEAFTLAQMRQNGIMQFFDIVKPVNAWDGTDLALVPALFHLFVADKNLGSLFVEKLPPELVGRSKSAVPRTMLSAVIAGAGQYGANLIELTESFSSYGAKVIKQDLSPLTDLDLIYRHELAGMYGDPEKIRTRLERYFNTGVNWDISKAFIFKDIPPPPPHYGRSPAAD